MTLAAVGTIIKVDTTTFSLTPANAGDLIALEIINTSNNTVTVTGMTSSNVVGGTWAQMGTGFAGTNNNQTASVWTATASAASAATVTIAWSGATPTIRGGGEEYSSTTGSWALDTQGHIDDPVGVSAWPSLTPAASGELYFGFAFNGGSASNGSTTGYTYQSDNHGNGMAYDAACTAAAQAPTWADSGQRFGIMMLIKEAGGVAAATPAPLVVPQAAVMQAANW